MGDAIAENVAWSYEQTAAPISALAQLVAFYQDRMDAWYEEDEPRGGDSGV